MKSATFLIQKIDFLKTETVKTRKNFPRPLGGTLCMFCEKICTISATLLTQKNNFLKNKDQCVHLTQKSVLLETKIFTPVTLLCHAHSVAQCASFAKILIQEDVWFSRDSIIFDSFAVVCVQFTAIHTKKCKFFLDTKKVEFFPGTFSHTHSVAQCTSFAHTSCTNAGAVNEEQHCVCP